MSQSLLSDPSLSLDRTANTERSLGRNRRNPSRKALLLAPQGRFLRYVVSGTATLLLLGFLSFSHWLDSRADSPDTSIRLLTGIQAVDIQAPPLPPPSEPPPPPPKTPPLPKLDIQIHSVAPPIKATTAPHIRPSMLMTSFSNEVPQQRERMIFSLTELDGQPKLLNRPSVTFPKSLRDRGLSEGKVSLEVKIHPNGQVDVLRVIESDDPEFTTVATNFATRARFSPPRKDGRPVAAQFHWPIIVR